MTSFVLLSENATELLDHLKVFLIKGRVLPCEILSADAPYYLRVEAKIGDPEIAGVLHVPHSAVVLIGTGLSEKQLGFI